MRISTAGGRSGLSPRRLAVLAALLVIVIVGVAVAIVWEPSTSPRYSIRQLRLAASNGDWDGVQAYFDAESVASLYVAAALESAFGDGDSDSGATGTQRGMGGSVGVGADMESTFVVVFADTLKRGIEDGTLSADDGGVAAILLGDAPIDIEEVSDTEASARMEVPTAAGDTEEVVLRMLWMDDHWRVMALEGITDLTGPLN